MSKKNCLPFQQSVVKLSFRFIILTVLTFLDAEVIQVFGPSGLNTSPVTNKGPNIVYTVCSLVNAPHQEAGCIRSNFGEQCINTGCFFGCLGTGKSSVGSFRQTSSTTRLEVISEGFIFSEFFQQR